MAYADLRMFMDDLKKIIHGNHHPLINNSPKILSKGPQFQLLYQELDSIIQTLFSIHEDHPHQHHELEKVRNLKKRFKDAAEEAQDTIDLFLSALHFTNSGVSPGSDVPKTFLNRFLFAVLFRNSRLTIISTDVLKTSLDLKKVLKSIKSIKVELKKINMKMDSSLRIAHVRTPYVAAGTSYTRNPLGIKKPSKEFVVGLDQDAEIIRDKLTEDTKQLCVVSIVGMGGQGKTTLATKLFNDPFIKYHFHIRAWATVSQTYIKRDFLIQILVSIGVQQGLDESNDTQLREKLHKKLIGRRYLIVIDDIWSIEAWDELKLFFPHDNIASRILFTSRQNEVALHVKPHGFVHSLPCLTEEESWELLKQKVFHGDECPEWLIEPGRQIARKCQGLPLSVVVMAGVLAKEAMSHDLWQKIACSVSSYIASDQKGCLKTLAFSYHHLPSHLRECFLYLGGFPEDFRIDIRKVTRLWVAEGFIEKQEKRCLEDTAKAYLMDLVDRNLVIIAERKFNGDVKACKLHDLVRELCMQKATEERFFLQIYKPNMPYDQVTTQYKQRHVFTNHDIYIVNLAYPPTPSIRSLLFFHKDTSLIYDIGEYFRSFALVRVLDLQKYEMSEFPQGITLLVHLRYLAIWHSLGFPFLVCNLWNLETLIVKTSYGPMVLPSNISQLVNLRHLWSNKELYLPSIGKPMNLQSISYVVLGDGVDNFQKCFPRIKKLASTLYLDEENEFKLLPYLDTLKLRDSGLHRRKLVQLKLPIHEPNFRQNHVWFPATLKKLTLVRCRLPWSNMSIIQPLPNLEVLKLIDNAFEGTKWNAEEQQFPQLKFLRLEELNIEHWEAYSTSFPCLRRLTVWDCNDLEEIPLEIGNIPTLELIETDSWNDSVVESVERIQEEQHEVGNFELKITVDGMDLSFYLSEHEGLVLDMELVVVL